MSTVHVRLLGSRIKKAVLLKGSGHSCRQHGSFQVHMQVNPVASVASIQRLLNMKMRTGLTQRWNVGRYGLSGMYGQKELGCQQLDSTFVGEDWGRLTRNLVSRSSMLPRDDRARRVASTGVTTAVATVATAAVGTRRILDLGVRWNE